MNTGPKVRRSPIWVRGGLLLVAAALACVFAIATQVRPYADDGSPLKMSSHQTLGLPPCNFKSWFDMPCPSCGMTTSFAHLVRGDVVNSVKANWVGTGLAIGCALVIPWAIVSALRGRYLFISRVDAPLALLVGILTVLMLVRWGGVLLLSLFD